MLIHLLIIIKNNLRANLLLMAGMFVIAYFTVVCCGLCVCCGSEPTEIIRV